VSGARSLWLLAGWVALAGCARPAPAPAPQPAPTVAVAPPVIQQAVAVAAPAVQPPTPTSTENASDQPAGDLVGEEPERDPRSATVTIKVLTEPRRPAHVVWGRKDLGATPLEIVRPRNSGPLDLVVVAPGFLPLHTRALTDRDDTLTVRLYGENEGPSLLGYHP
jgi:hypothetical protein